jgi:CO/xanthine dehydrogenase FAD-binding subunit
VRAIRYVAPSTVDEAVSVLVEYGEGARMLAGGTDLIVQVREYLRDWEVFVDAKRIPALMAISIAGDGSLTLGAAVPCAAICADRYVTRTFPGLVDSASIIGGIAIQSRASIGGNLCNSGPAADSIPTLIAYRARCDIDGPNGRRSVPVEDFCTAPGRNVLQPGELLVSLNFPAPAPGSGAAYLRFIPRGEMDIAEVGAAAQVALDGQAIASARIAVGAVAPTPLYVPEAGSAIAGRPPTQETYALAAAAAQAAARPITDMRGTAEHRRHLVGVLTARALRRAAERAKASAR